MRSWKRMTLLTMSSTVEETPIPDLNAYGALIVLGGSQNADEDDRYPYLSEEKRLLRQVVAQDIPYLGICLGGQLPGAQRWARLSRAITSQRLAFLRYN